MTGTNKKNFDVRRLLTSILAVVMIAAVILGCVGMLAGCSEQTGNKGENNVNKGENNVDNYAEMTDAEYFQALAAVGIGNTLGSIAPAYGALTEIAGAASGNFGTKAELSLQVGDMILDELEQFLPMMMGTTLDLSFLSKIGLGLEVDGNDELTQLQLSLGLSDTQILALRLLMSDDTIWVGAPDLSKNYLEVNMGLLGIPVANSMVSELATEVLSVLPSEDKLTAILDRYLTLAIKEFDKVERADTTLELDGLKQNVTKLTVDIYEQDALDAVRAVLTAAKDDQDIKKIVDDFASCYNDMWRDLSADWEDMDLYAAFVEGIEDALEEIPTEAETTDSIIGLILYVDKDHNVVGFGVDLSVLFMPVMSEPNVSMGVATAAETDADETYVFTYYTVTEGNNFATTFNTPLDTFVISGKGTTNNGVINGKFSVVYEGTAYLTFELKNFETNENKTSGTISLAPTEETIDAIFNGPIPYLSVDDIAVELELDITDNKTNINVKLVGDDAMIVGIALKLSAKDSATVKKPANTIQLTGMQSVADLLGDMDFTSVFKNLRKAGVPDELVSTLEGLAQMVG